MKNKITQKQLAFYKLYKKFKDNHEEYLDTWEFGGEIHIIELGRWELMSYKCPARLSDIYNENPDFLERRIVTGKSGSKYFQYRITNISNPIEKLVDPILLEFYRKVKN